MHLVIHTQYYPPELGAPQARLSELAQYMAKTGHRVTILTAMPSYPQGKVYAGYGGLLQKEKSGDIEIVRTAIYATQKVSFLPRLLNYFSFVFSSLLIGGWHIARADFILTESPPLFLGLAGFLLSRWKRAKWIFNVSDLWPESAVYLGVLDRTSLAYKISAWLEIFCYRQAHVVTGQSRDILKSIQQRFPNVPTYHLSNGVDTRLFGASMASPDSRRELGGENEFVLLYAGLHGLAQGLEQVLEAAAGLLQVGSYRFVLIGDGPEKKMLQERCERDGLINVTFGEARPREKIAQLLASADAIIVPLKVNLPGAVPSKLYEAMASARPVFLVAEGEAAEIVQRCRAGIVTHPGDTAALVRAIQELAQEPSRCAMLGQNGRQAAEMYYDRQRIAQSFQEYLENL